MDDLKLVIGLDGSMWVSPADVVDMVPAGKGVFVYHMENIIVAANEVLAQKRYARVRKRVTPTAIPSAGKSR
jgi:hypothetical protein